MSTGLVQRSSSAENAEVSHSKGLKPKPLQASTNIIHTKIPRRIDNLIHDKTKQLPCKQLSDPLKKQSTLHKKQIDLKSSQTPKINENDYGPIQKSTTKDSIKNSTPNKKVDENDMSAMIKNAYNPLNDVYPFDEELYQRVLKLELADDGIPDYDYSEPFDF